MKTLDYILIAVLLLVLCALSTSCEDLQTHNVAANGSTEDVHYRSLGGSGVLDTAGGTRYTHNHNKSFGQAMQTLTAAAAALGKVATVNSDNALAKSKDANATAVTQQKQQLDAAAAAQAAQNKANAYQSLSDKVPPGSVAPPVLPPPSAP